MMPMTDDLDEAEITRYARQIVLPEIGPDGQRRLRSAAVLVVGAGGLGAPLLLYLAAAGVGRIAIVDDDRVELSNLHRQVLFTEPDVGRLKAAAAADRLQLANSAIRITAHETRLSIDNAQALIGDYDLVADGSDNVATRALVQSTCHRLRRPLISAAVQGMDGQISTFTPYLGPPHPCWQCLFSDETAADSLPSCASSGILGPVAGVIGTMQALEVIKELTGTGRRLSGRLLLYDAGSATLDEMAVARRPECVLGCVHDALADLPVAPRQRLALEAARVVREERSGPVPAGRAPLSGRDVESG